MNGSPEEEAIIALQRTADMFQQQLQAVLKPGGLSLTQFNVLRILAEAGPEGLPCGEVANRMISRDPDMTRLLDRMEARGLVTRARQRADRRVITARITPLGSELAVRYRTEAARLTRRQLGPLSREEVGLLLAMLDRLCAIE